jgi:hypothetical protein
MAIKSSDFGRVTFTGDDAKKFRNQVKHGRPNSTAVDNLKRGANMYRAFKDNGGKITLSLRRG